MLSVLREDVLGKFTNPLLEERGNDAGVIQIRLIQEVDIKLYVRISVSSVGMRSGSVHQCRIVSSTF